MKCSASIFLTVDQQTTGRRGWDVNKWGGGLTKTKGLGKKPLLLSAHAR